MADLRAKRLTNAKEDGQDRYHETRRPPAPAARRKMGLKPTISPARPRRPKANREFWVTFWT